MAKCDASVLKETLAFPHAHPVAWLEKFYVGDHSRPGQVILYGIARIREIWKGVLVLTPVVFPAMASCHATQSKRLEAGSSRSISPWQFLSPTMG